MNAVKVTGNVDVNHQLSASSAQSPRAVMVLIVPVSQETMQEMPGRRHRRGVGRRTE